AEIVAAVYDRRIVAQPFRLRSESVRKLEACATLSAVIDRRYRRIRPNEVMVCSTGRIGVSLPMLKVERGIRACASLLARSDGNAGATAEAIMTSDTRRKE